MFRATDRFIKKSSLETKAGQVSPEDYPAIWKKVFYKEYPRFLQVDLKLPEHPAPQLKDLLFKRQSLREFSDTPIPFDIVSGCLYYSAGLMVHTKQDYNNRLDARFYPSAGKRYPTEVYFIARRVESMPQGIYHYNVNKNNVELINEDVSDSVISPIFINEWVNKSPITFILTSVLTRTQLKYGERGLRYSFFEAGHVAQNLLLNSVAFGLSACPIGGFIDRELEKLIGIRSEFSGLHDISSREKILYCITAGHAKDVE